MPKVRKVGGGNRQRRVAVAQERRPGEKEAQEEATRAALKDLGLEPGDTVRFRRTRTGSWTEATVSGVAKDGSLQLWERGKARSILPNLCEVKRRGPRGGIKWEPIQKT